MGDDNPHKGPTAILAYQKSRKIIAWIDRTYLEKTFQS